MYYICYFILSITVECVAKKIIFFFSANYFIHEQQPPRTMISFPTGACALGSECMFATLELRPQHKCKHCKQIVHVLCAKVDGQDMHYCKNDCRKPTAIAHLPPLHPSPPNPLPQVPIPFPLPILFPPGPVAQSLPPLPFDGSICHAATNPNATKPNKRQKGICPSCKGTDHLRVSSMKCKFYKKRINTRAKQTSSSSSSSFPTEIATESTDPVDIPLRNEDVMSTPNYIKFDSETTYQRVFNVDDVHNKTSSTQFMLMKQNEQGRKIRVLPSVTNLVDLFLGSTSFVEPIVINSNTYIHKCKLVTPTADIWRRKNDCRPITACDVYQFIAILYYMGIVR